MKLTKVIINSVTIKDSNGSPDPRKVLNWEYTKDADAISEAEIKVTKDINDLLDLSSGQIVEIYGGTTTSTDTRYFYGKIDSIKPDGSTFVIACSNEMIDLVRKNVNHIYDSSVDTSAGEVSEIVEDLIETYGGLTASVQASGTADGERVDEFKCINSDIYERIIALKKALGWDLFYDDDNRIVHFEPKGYTDSEKTLTVKDNILGLPEWDINTDNMINDLRVDGATVETTISESGQIGTTEGYTTSSILLNKTPNSAELLIDSASPPTTQKEGGSKDASSTGYYYIDRENKKLIPKTDTTFTTDDYAKINYIWSSPAPIHMKNQASIDLYGYFQKTLEISDITSVADAESRATSILSTRSVPFVTGRIKVKLTDVPGRGQLVQVVDTITPTVSGNQLSGDYVVNSIKYMWPSAFEEIEVGDSQWRLADWQENTESRLKRLEEQFVRNQDILMELRNFNNSEDENFKKPTPRYFKTITEAYDTGNNRMIWDNTDHGVWDSDTWGDGTDTFEAEVVAFMMQAGNTYTEDFVDTDFFDDPNSTGDWLTGVITVGQTLRSLPIDYANGTITQATATFTESGAGTPTFYLSADGGSNWESVTSGTAHTFSNTGTSLMWRVDSATDTTTVTGVAISSYH